jgi:hypothetical protein
MSLFMLGYFYLTLTICNFSGIFQSFIFFPSCLLLSQVHCFQSVALIYCVIYSFLSLNWFPGCYEFPNWCLFIYSFIECFLFVCPESKAFLHCLHVCLFFFDHSCCGTLMLLIVCMHFSLICFGRLFVISLFMYSG